MNAQDKDFPAYRKYKNGKNYFKIINALNFEEIRIIGSTKKISRIFAGQYSEKRFLNQLWQDYKDIAVEISEAEYEEIKKGAN
jgi:hypothetical protein